MAAWRRRQPDPAVIVIDPSAPILFVDDDRADRMVIQVVLERSALPNPVRGFDGGAALLEYIASAASGAEPAPALVLVDVNMPGMTGFDVVKRIRAYEQFRELPPVSMLTSSDAEDDKIRAAEVGADNYLAKQSGVDAFVAMIDAAFAAKLTDQGAV